MPQPNKALLGGDAADVELGDDLGIVEDVDRYRAVADNGKRQDRERPLAVEGDPRQRHR
jgi:hypothetical protein